MENNTDKVKNNNFGVLQLITFLATPLLSFIPILIGIRNNNKRSYILLVLFMGIIGYLTAPTGDLYRYHQEYSIISSMELSEFVNEYLLQKDFVIPVIDFIYSTINLPAQLLSFTSLVVLYSIVILIYKKYILERNSKYSFIFFLIIFFSIDFFKTSLGIRYMLASYMFAYAIISDVFDEKINYKFLLLSVFIHYSFIVFIPIALLWRKIKVNRTRAIYYLSFILMFFGVDLLQLIFEFLVKTFPNSDILRETSYYFIGYWGEEYLQNRSLKNIILNNIRYIPYYIILVYFLITKKEKYDRRLIYMLLSINNITFGFPNIFGRFNTFILFIGIIFIIKELHYKSINYNNIFKQIMLPVFILIFSLNIFAQRRNVMIGYLPKMLYQPLVVLIFNTYDNEWFINNVNSEGLIINPCCPDTIIKK